MIAEGRALSAGRSGKHPEAIARGVKDSDQGTARAEKLTETALGQTDAAIPVLELSTRGDSGRSGRDPHACRAERFERLYMLTRLHEREVLAEPRGHRDGR
jgi:hypothetical protein